MSADAYECTVLASAHLNSYPQWQQHYYAKQTNSQQQYPDVIWEQECQPFETGIEFNSGSSLKSSELSISNSNETALEAVSGCDLGAGVSLGPPAFHPNGGIGRPHIMCVRPCTYACPHYCISPLLI